MCRLLRFSGWIAALAVAALATLGVWLLIVRPDPLRLASAYAARTVCSNVFVARRSVESILHTDLLALGHPIFHLMTIDVSVSDQSVEVSLLGLFAKRRAIYVEGWGCTSISGDEHWDRPAAQPDARVSSAEALWPVGEAVQLSDNKRLKAVLATPGLQGPGMRAIVVVRDGRIIAETYGEGFSASTPLLGWSMTKAVTAALIGMTIKDGKISLDRQSLFPQWAGDERDGISVANLLEMSGGLEWNEDQGIVNDPGRMEYLIRDAAAFARDRRLFAPPGTTFHYSSGASVLLTRLWQSAIGEAAPTYPRERLFAPLGMTSAVLEADESGTFLGEGFLYASARDWVRFGEFLRLGGVWEGQQILPAGFVDYMRSPAPPSDQGRGPVYARGQIWLARGLGFDLPADTFMLLGHNRQAIAIIPSRKLVVLRMGSTREDVGYSVADLLHLIVVSAN